MKRDTLREPTTLILHRDKNSVFNAMNAKSVLKNHIPLKINNENRREILNSDRETSRKFVAKQAFELSEEAYFCKKGERNEEICLINERSTHFDFEGKREKLMEEKLFSFNDKNDGFNDKNEQINCGNETTIRFFDDQQMFQVGDRGEGRKADFQKTIKKSEVRKQEQFNNEDQVHIDDSFARGDQLNVTNDFNNLNLKASIKDVKYDEKGFQNKLDEDFLLDKFENHEQKKVKFQKMELLRSTLENKLKWGRLKRDESIDKMNVKIAKFYESNTLETDFGEEGIKKADNSNFLFTAREKKYSFIY